MTTHREQGEDTMTRRLLRSSTPAPWRRVLTGLPVVGAWSGSGPWAPAGGQAVQSQTGDNGVLENEFIAIIVNARDEATGRFSVNPTGGEPERIGDENRPLVYGTVNDPGPV